MIDPDERELLHSVVAVARAIYGAPGSAVFLLDKECDALVFQAVSGIGEDHLVGSRFPADFGVFGWVINSGESIIVDDVAGNRRCAQEIHDVIGYLPDTIMAAPLLSGRETLGVLVVLDPGPQSRSSLPDLELLGLFANQAAVALNVVARHRADPGQTRAALLEELREFLLRDCA